MSKEQIKDELKKDNQSDTVDQDAKSIEALEKVSEISTEEATKVVSEISTEALEKVPETSTEEATEEAATSEESIEELADTAKVEDTFTGEATEASTEASTEDTEESTEDSKEESEEDSKKESTEDTEDSKEESEEDSKKESAESEKLPSSFAEPKTPWYKRTVSLPGAVALALAVFAASACLLFGVSHINTPAPNTTTEVSETTPLSMNDQKLQLVKYFQGATITNQYGTDGAKVTVPEYFANDVTVLWDNYSIIAQTKGMEFFSQFISMEGGVKNSDVFDSFKSGMESVSTDFTEVSRSEDNCVFTVTLNEEKVKGKFQLIKGTTDTSFIEVTYVTSDPDIDVSTMDLSKYVEFVKVPAEMKEQAEKDMEEYLNYMLSQTMGAMQTQDSNADTATESGAETNTESTSETVDETVEGSAASYAPDDNTVVEETSGENTESTAE